MLLCHLKPNGFLASLLLDVASGAAVDADVVERVVPAPRSMLFLKKGSRGAPS